VDERKIVIEALKVEAKNKPNERIFVGSKSYTYQEFALMLDKKVNSKAEREFVESFINSAVKMFKENKTFREKMKKLAGVGE